MKKILIILAVMLTLGISTYAQEPLQISYNQETSEIAIEVSGIEKDSALISVVNGKYENGTDITSRDYIFFKELYSDGTVICKIPRVAHSGEYTIAAVIDGEITTKAFWYTNESEAASVLEKLAKATDVATVKTVLETEYEQLGIDYEEFKPYADDISELFFALFDGTDKKLADFRNTYYGAYAIAKAKTLSKADAEQVFFDYSTELGISRGTYNALTTEAKDVFLQLFASGEIHTNNIKDQMSEYLFLSEINSEQAWVQFSKLITEKYQKYLSIDIKRLTESGRQEELTKQLMQKGPYKSKQGFLTEYQNVTVQTKPTPMPSSGGGSGSSSSGGGYVKTDIPAATPKPTQESNPEFSDVSKAYWAYDSIKKLSEEGIVNGFENNRFMPENNITRAEFAAMTVRMFYPQEKASDRSLPDVSVNDWYCEPVVLLNDKGVLNGDDTGNINPTENITRQDACVVISRILNLSSDSEASFDDTAEISGYAVGAVSALHKQGIVNGRENNCFAPHEFITRAEAAAMLYRILGNTEGIQ